MSGIKNEIATTNTKLKLKKAFTRYRKMNYETLVKSIIFKKDKRIH